MPTQGFSSDEVENSLKLSQLAKEQQAMQGLSALQAKNAADEDAIRGLQARQAGLTTTYHPQFESPAGKGFLGGLDTMLENFGKEALLAATGTVPGQAVESAYYAQPRQEYEKLAKQIETIRGGEEQRSKLAEPYAQIAARAPMGYGSIVRGEAEKLRAATYQEYTHAQAKIQENRNDILKHGQELRDKIANKKLTVEQARTDMMKYVADKQAASRTDVANIMSGTQEDVQMQRSSDQEMKQESDHWFQSWTGLLPQKPVKTAAGRTSGASSTAAPSAGGVKVTDPRGVAHTFPDQKSADNFKKAAGIK
jgi:hypothetical protein